MKKDFTPENIEDFLKRSADSLRMKPGDKVWQNLSKELGKSRRRYLLGLGIFLLVISAVGYYAISNVSAGTASLLPKTELRKPDAPSTASRETNAKGRLTSESSDPVAVPVSQPRSHSSLATEPKPGITAVSSGLGKEDNVSTTGLITTNEITAQTTFTPTVVDSYTEFDDHTTGTKAETKANTQVASNAFPLTIESVINAYKAKNKIKRFEAQLYFTPSISYRKLAENKSYLRTLDPNAVPATSAAFYSSVNSNVTHKPDVGFETGVTTKYAFSNRLKLRAGLQFNVNRYDVKAFSSPLSVATIALSNGQRIDSFNTFSAYSNVNGYKSNWLQNLSFQLSLPVGVEYLFKGTDKMQFGVAATVQPTYILGDRAYLITTDYKNYTEVPWLTRRWNVNTALETFVKYKGWQVGPQVRYQLLSSFVSKYPVKENLFDFGLKVGIPLSKQ